MALQPGGLERERCFKKTLGRWWTAWKPKTRWRALEIRGWATVTTGGVQEGDGLNNAVVQE